MAIGDKNKMQKKNKATQNRDVENIEDILLNAQIYSHQYQVDDGEELQEMSCYSRGMLFLCDNRKNIGHLSSRCSCEGSEDRKTYNSGVYRPTFVAIENEEPFEEER